MIIAGPRDHGVWEGHRGYVQVTPQAAQQVKVAAERGGTASMALRLAAQRPDSSIDYRMGFDEGTGTISASARRVQIAPEYVPAGCRHAGFRRAGSRRVAVHLH